MNKECYNDHRGLVGSVCTMGLQLKPSNQDSDFFSGFRPIFLIKAFYAENTLFAVSYDQRGLL